MTFSNVLHHLITLCGGLRKADALFTKEMLHKLQQYVEDYQTYGSPEVLAIAFQRMYLLTKTNNN